MFVVKFICKKEMHSHCVPHYSVRRLEDACVVTIYQNHYWNGSPENPDLAGAIEIRVGHGEGMASRCYVENEKGKTIDSVVPSESLLAA